MSRRPRERLGGLDVEVVRRGAGRPILVLHGVHDFAPDMPFLDGLARLGEVVAPTHPGFGGTARPDDFATMYDLVHHYRGVTETLAPALVVGLSFGGWIAAELAAAGAAMERLVLVDALGVRFGGREDVDIAHLFNSAPADLLARAWSDPSARPPGRLGVGWPLMLAEHDDAELVRLNASNEALSLYGWRPHMHNPQLRRWLHRISVPTLVLWGEQDRIVTPDYGRRYAAEIPAATFETIAGAAHHPELEQPEAVLRAVAAFVAATAVRAAA